MQSILVGRAGFWVNLTDTNTWKTFLARLSFQEEEMDLDTIDTNNKMDP